MKKLDKSHNVSILYYQAAIKALSAKVIRFKFKRSSGKKDEHHLYIDLKPFCDINNSTLLNFLNSKKIITKNLNTGRKVKELSKHKYLLRIVIMKNLKDGSSALWNLPNLKLLDHLKFLKGMGQKLSENVKMGHNRSYRL